jgi:hypothetical protein
MVVWLRRVPWARRGRRRSEVDPFSALEVQLALSRLEHEISALLADGSERFAQGHHLQAAMLAYEQALLEACRLAGVPSLPEGRRLRRVMAEAELRVRGWTW